MNKTLELMWKVIVNPVEAFDEIREEKSIYTSLIYLLIYGIVAVAAGHFAGLIAQKTLTTPPNAGNLPPNLTPFFKNFDSTLKALTSSSSFFILGLVMPYINVFLTASIYDLLAQFITKKANGRVLFTAFAFASMPILIYKLILLAFAALMSYTIPAWIELIFVIWGIVLYILAIRETYEIDSGTAIGIYFTPIVILIIIVVIYILSLVPFIMNLLKTLPHGAFTP